MDYQEPKDHQPYWTAPMLQEWILKVAYQSQGHTPRCKCPWCTQGDRLLAILETRPDLIHEPGGRCEEGCRHERR